MTVQLPRSRTYLRADERRAQILQVAKRVFASRGYHRVNVADICDAARISRGTLYQYFENKRAVLLALLEGIAERLEGVLEERTQVAQVAGAAQAPPAMVLAFAKERLRDVLGAVFEDEATLRLLLRQARGLDGALDALVRRIDDLVLGYAEDDIRGAQALGLFRGDIDPLLVARFVLGGIEKMVLTALARDEAIDLEAIIEVAVTVQLLGLMKEGHR
jgi:AcrR family transcriptional regulator